MNGNASTVESLILPFNRISDEERFIVFVSNLEDPNLPQTAIEPDLEEIYAT